MIDFKNSKIWTGVVYIEINTKENFHELFQKYKNEDFNGFFYCHIINTYTRSV